jgi:predicted ribosomally synthesized peptide with SipW-like signal peptide
MGTTLTRMVGLARSARVRAALSLGVVTAIGATGTFAYWTDAATITGTTFTAGTIDLKVNNADSVSGYTALNISAMVPGNSTAGLLTIKNTGTAPLKFTATSSSTPSVLSGAMTVKVTGDSAVTGSSPSATCAGAALAGSATTIGGATGSSLIGTGRLLSPGQSETVCIQVTLPSTASSSLQGTSSDVTFAFTGTSDLS